MLPTPAAPLLIGRYDFDLAVVLSASHNPYEDNGIKFFAGDGYKLSDETELEIERELERAERSQAGAGERFGRFSAIGRVRDLRGAGEDYLRELHSALRRARPGGLDVLLDCANGATHHVAPEIFRRLGAKVTVMADGRTGATSTPAAAPHTSSSWAKGCAREGHAVGFAFDGDGDRVLAVDRRGRSSTATS